MNSFDGEYHVSPREVRYGFWSRLVWISSSLGISLAICMLLLGSVSDINVVILSIASGMLTGLILIRCSLFLSQEAACEKAYQATHELKQKLARCRQLLKDSQDGHSQLTAKVAQAEGEFQARGFIVFYDIVDSCVPLLKNIEGALSALPSAIAAYRAALVAHKHNFPESPVSEKDIPNVLLCSQQLCKLMDKAQRDFQFASIYEQRRSRMGAAMALEQLKTLSEQLSSSSTVTAVGVEVSMPLNL